MSKITSLAALMLFNPTGQAVLPAGYLTPGHMRRLWQTRDDLRASAWHDCAQKLSLYWSGNCRDKFKRSMTTATEFWSFDRTMQQFRLSRCGINCRATQQSHKFAAVVDAARAQLKTAGNTAVPPVRKTIGAGTVIIHEFAASESSRDYGRWADRARLRQALAEPKLIAGPQDTESCDILFSQLYEESPWLSEPLTWMWRAAKLHMQTIGRFRVPPVVLAGPPGCGKTHLAQRIGILSNCGFLRLDLSSATAAFSLTGAEFTWGSSEPGRPIQQISDTGIANPVIVLDELEKRGRSDSGADVAQALLPLLQADTARQFQSPYLCAPIDLSHVNWIICVNDVSLLPAPLLDRTRVLHCIMPTGKHLKQLVIRTLGEDVAPEVRQLALDAMQAGQSLRWLHRLGEQIRAINAGPVLH